MDNITLYIPKLEDLYFRQQCMADPKTMSYNAGYNLSFAGYHYDSGCIDFPKENWESWYKTKIINNPNFFYAYILNTNTSEFVGYVNFNLDPNTNTASIGIVIKSEHQGNGYMRPALNLLINEAKKRNISALTDTVPQTRKNALKVFYDLGFVCTKTDVGEKFDGTEIIEYLELKL